MKNIYIFVGTTAEFIKIAPVIKELKKRKKKFKLIATGQNKINFKEFEWYLGKIKPDIELQKKNQKSSLLLFAVWAVQTLFIGSLKLHSEFKNKNKKNTILIVHGDTVSSAIGALIAKLFSLKLVHVESGLRSFNFLEPFPEEIDRFIISRIADVHFCPNEWSVNNLRGKSGEIYNTKQNTLYDIYSSVIKTNEFKKAKRITKEKYFVLIMHRQEHVLFEKDKSLDVLEHIINNSDLKCLLIAHDISKSVIEKLNVDESKLITLNRKPYAEFMSILKNSEFVATDGGSNQEELYYMGKPTLILRNVTERIEGLNENAMLSKLNKSKIKNFIKKYKSFKKHAIRQRFSPAKYIIDNIL